MSKVVTSVAGDAKPVETKPMSESDFLSARIARFSPAQPEGTKPAESAPSSEPESKPEAAEEKQVPSQEAAPVEPESQKDVLSKDISELTDEEIAELAAKGKSGLLKRIAELTAKRKLAEERLAAIEMERQREIQQLPERVENNPYESIADVEQLQAKRKEVDEVIDWAEDVLFRSEDLGATDIAAVVDGKEYTKADIRDSLRKARKARDKFIPAQFQELQAQNQRAQMENAFRMQARKELSWLEGEDNDTRKRFEAMVSDPRLKKLKQSVPEIAPQIEYLVAHAANSMFGRKSIPIDSDRPRSPTLNPPSNPPSSAAAPERAESRVERSVKDLESRFKESGKPNDFLAFRSAQIASKRK